MQSFREHLNKELKDPKFAKAYNEEKKIIELAVRIAEERNRLGISQAELAKKARVTQQQLSKVENGANYTMKTFLKIADALKISIL